MTPLTSMDTVFRVIDTETTGFEPPAAGVCEVAYADMRAGGKVAGAFESLVNPGHPIPPTASAVHHITDDQVSDSPALGDLLESLAAPVYVAHNAEFDSRFLADLPGEWVCTYRLAKHLWPEAPGHGLQALRYWLGLVPDVPAHTAAHRAMADVMVTVALFDRQLGEVAKRWPEVATVAALVERIRAPALLHVVPFKSACGATFEHADIGLLQWIVRKGAGGPDCVHSALHWLNQRGVDEEDDGGWY